jgi:hypothetical protein
MMQHEGVSFNKPSRKEVISCRGVAINKQNSPTKAWFVRHFYMPMIDRALNIFASAGKFVR